ncbi:MAG TPA: HEPN/Toprim-associated domain-containing protein [Azospirillum sp.]|nr:HEPN/Toprim-associated domain-containing protein [Azospirillum sp.]
MGSMIHLAVGRLEIDWGKNSGFTDHSALFQPGDLAQVPYYYVKEDGGTYTDTAGEERYELEVVYKDGMSKPLWQVVDRIELLGHTLAHCEREFPLPGRVQQLRHRALHLRRVAPGTDLDRRHRRVGRLRGDGGGLR